MCLEVGLSIVAYQTVVHQKEEYRHCAGPGEAKPEAGTCRNRDRGKEDEVIALARAPLVGADWVGEETGGASVCNDADTSSVLNYRVGGGNANGATEFTLDRAAGIKGRMRVTTDGHKSYLEAVETASGRLRHVTKDLRRNRMTSHLKVAAHSERGAYLRSVQDSTLPQLTSEPLPSVVFCNVDWVRIAQRSCRSLPTSLAGRGNLAVSPCSTALSLPIIHEAISNRGTTQKLFCRSDRLPD
jgi:hypothetical protein